MSAARSVTACCGGLFLPHPHPPADVGQRRPRFLLPPTYFCTSSIFEAGTKIFVPPWNSSSRCSSACSFFSSSLQPAIAADAVRQVDDVVAFAQLEKAVDHAAQPAPRGPVQVGAMKQLAAADQRDRDRPPGESRPSSGPSGKCSSAGGGQPRRGEDFLAAARLSASVWQTMNTSCSPARPAPIEASSSSRTLAMSPLNRSTDSIPKWQVVSSEPAGTPAAVTDGNRVICRSVRETL